MKKKLVSILLAASMVLTMMPATAFAKTTGAVQTAKMEQTNPDKLVRMVVVMDGKPLLEQGYSVSTTAKQAKAESKAEEMMDKQDALFSKITGKQGNQIRKEAGKDTGKITLNYHFTLALNGMSITAPYKELSTIRKMDGVRAVFLAREHKLITPKTQESGKMIGRDDTWASGYTGKGMKIAIVDTGINVSHPAFKALPQNKLTDKSITEASLDKEIQACGMKLHAFESNGGSLKAADVYRNSKIPFGYNYAEKKIDVEHQGGSDHGTHVAGIAAADKTVTPDGTVVGVAPDAQLMVMKVFGQEAGASDDAILAAVDDAVLLGADVINMSLGSTAGFTEALKAGQWEEQETLDWLNRTYANIGKTDTLLEVSAGNEGSSAQGNLYDQYLGVKKNSTDNPDNSTVGDPSTYYASMSIASIDNEKAMQHYMTAGGKTITYNDSLTEKTLKTLGGKSYRFAMVGNLGKTVKDFKKAGVKGKIAVVQRGEITFVEKQANALAAGAVACIVYDNAAEGILSMSVEEVLPCVSITLENGKYLESLAKKGKTKITINKNGKYFYQGSNIMSDFTSWGVTPDLQLKPELTAPGGNIYSSTDKGTFGLMSGTSMASPHAAGVAALVKEKLEESGTVLSTGELRKRVDNLMMSTAVPALFNEKEEIPYSPRLQGAGLVNVYQAITSNAYLSVGENGRPKVSLKDDPGRTGKYQFTFKVNNTSDHSLTFTPKTSVMTEDVLDYQEEGIPTFMSETPRLLKDAEVAYSGSAFQNGKVTVGAKSTGEVAVTVTLTKEEKEMLSQEFANGIYIEGFVRLIPEQKEEVSLTLPYMGFYGDWTDTPIFDGGVSDDYIMTRSLLLAQFAGQEAASVIGASVNNNSDITESHFVVSPNEDGYYDTLQEVDLSTLRNAKEVKVIYRNHKTGEVYDHGTEVINYARKSCMNEDTGNMEASTYLSGFDFKNEKGEYLPNGTVIDMIVTAQLDYSQHSPSHENKFEVPITVDTKAPEADVKNAKFDVDAKTGKKTLTLTMTDNTYLADVSFGTNQFQKVLGLAEFEDKDFTENQAGEKTVTKAFDITGYGDQFQMVMEDYGCNETELTVDVKNQTVTVEDAENTEMVLQPSEGSAVGFEAIVADMKGQIKDAAGAETDISLDMGSATILPGKVLAAMAGKNVILTASLGDGTAYTFDGYELKKKDAKDTQLAVTYEEGKIPQGKIKALAGKRGTKSLQISDQYKLSGQLVISLADVMKKTDHNACLYRYQKTTGKLVFVGTSAIDENGMVSFSINRGGNYLVISGMKH